MIPLEPSAAELERLVAACADFVREHIGTLGEQPASDLDGAEALARTFHEPAPESGRALPLDRLRTAVGKSFNTAGPGYMAFIPGGGLPTAALADFLATATNRFVGLDRAAPALAAIERQTVRWLAGMMGCPDGTRGILTSGGSISNLVALVTARSARLGEDFSRGVIYVSGQTHASVAKAARIAGFPAGNLRSVATDGRLRLDPAALERAIADDRAAGLLPFLVVVNVGTTNTGAIDPIPQVLEIARRHELWVHADAAYGGFFRIAPGGAALMPGIGECDSITLDPHKGLFLPYGTGCVLVRDGEALERAHRTDAAYLRDAASGEEPSFADLGPELSRDFRGLRLWLPLVVHGLARFRSALGEKLELARYAWERLRTDARFEIIDEPQLSIVAFRRKDVDGAALLQRVNARRRVFLSSTEIGGRLTLRICVLSFRTHLDRVREALDVLME